MRRKKVDFFGNSYGNLCQFCYYYSDFSSHPNQWAANLIYHSGLYAICNSTPAKSNTETTTTDQSSNGINGIDIITRIEGKL